MKSVTWVSWMTPHQYCTIVWFPVEEVQRNRTENNIYWTRGSPITMFPMFMTYEANPSEVMLDLIHLIPQFCQFPIRLNLNGQSCHTLHRPSRPCIQSVSTSRTQATFFEIFWNKWESTAIDVRQKTFMIYDIGASQFKKTNNEIMQRSLWFATNWYFCKG